MNPFSALYAVIIVFAASCPTLACDLDGFDSGAPPAESDETNRTEKSHFAWGSDADPWGSNQNNSRSWHYIRNLHESKLSLNWKKPGLLIPFDNPLAKEDCRSTFDYGHSGSFEIEYNAPIKTSNDGSKEAIAFVRIEGTEQEIDDSVPNIAGTQIRADYRTEDGERATAITWLVAYFFPYENVLQIEVFSGNGGETMAFRPDSLGLSIDQFGEQLSKRGGKIIEIASLETLVAMNTLSAEAFEGIANNNFIRISTKNELNLSFTGISDVPAGQTSVLLFSPQGSLLAAKRLSTSTLGDRRD